MELFFVPASEIDKVISELQKGQTFDFPIVNKASVTARVSEANRKYEATGQKYTTRTDRINYKISVIRTS